MDFSIKARSHSYTLATEAEGEAEAITNRDGDSSSDILEAIIIKGCADAEDRKTLFNLINIFRRISLD